MITAFRSIFGERWMDHFRRILVWKSTSVGMLKGKPGWSLRSTQSIYVLGGQWSWSSSWEEQERWFLFAYDPQYLLKANLLKIAAGKKTGFFEKLTISFKSLTLRTHSPEILNTTYQGTSSCHRWGRCWRTGPYECRHRTSWWSCSRFREFQRIPFPGKKAGRELQGNGTSRFQQWWPG